MSQTTPALDYRRAGNGEDVVLIHGVGSRADDWSGVIGALGGGFSVLSYDQRGHGGSDAPPGPYTIEQLTADLIGLLDELGITRAHVAGFSLGGLVAQALALRHPDRIRKMVLISTVAQRSHEERARVIGRLDFIARSHPADYFDQSVERWFTQEFRKSHPEVIAKRKATVESMDQAAYAAAYHALAHTEFQTEDLERIKSPTLVVTGEDDIGSNPRMARLLHECIPDSQLRILPGLRHSLLLEAPETVGRMLRSFFRDEPVP